jgi:hypothetical protein
MDSHQAWLAGLKAGDPVAIELRSVHLFNRVGRVTKTLIVLKTGGKFRKCDGRKVGSFFGDRLVELTPELLAETKAYQEKVELSRFFDQRVIPGFAEGVPAIVAAIKKLKAEYEIKLAENQGQEGGGE